LYLKTISETEATGEIAERYTADIAAMGLLMEATSAWSARPDMLVPVENLLQQMRGTFSLGPTNFRLITFVAAKYVPSSYCAHMYFRSLSNVLGRDKVIAIHRDYRNAGLTAAEVAMLDYVRQITLDASKITPADIETLRGHGFSDLNIADIALATSLRCFMSRYFDAVGATVEEVFLDDDLRVRAELAVGKAT
jgi:uncharacterized peroxidase-related enzyme